jgi:hypothetical protein
MAEARLTVILVVGPQRPRAERALASVVAEARRTPLEILLADLAPGNPPLPSGTDGCVRAIPGTAADTFASARARGVALAGAPIVAFLEEHTEALPGWAEAVTRAFEGPWAAVTYEIHNANPNEGQSRASHFLGYARQSPPALRREVSILPGQNSAYRRDLLRSFRDDLPDLLTADPAMAYVLRQGGGRFLLEPEARIRHVNEPSVWLLMEGTYLYHRAAAPVRARRCGWTLLRRLAYVALAPVVPLYRLVRLGSWALARGPRAFVEFVRTVPAVLAVAGSSAAGQAAGLALGAGNAAARFSRYELGAPRTRGDLPVNWR